MSGGKGSDVLLGGDGSDTLTGGAGKDIFDFRDYGERWRVDEVTDFRRGEDKLAFTASFLGFDRASDVRLYNGADPKAPAGHAALLYETDSHRLWLDRDGAGTTVGPDLIAVLDGVGKLALSDFLFA